MNAVTNDEPTTSTLGDYFVGMSTAASILVGEVQDCEPIGLSLLPDPH